MAVGGEGGKMEERMPEEIGLPLEPWDYPEERKRMVGEALELSLIHISEPTRPY